MIMKEKQKNLVRHIQFHSTRYLQTQPPHHDIDIDIIIIIIIFSQVVTLAKANMHVCITTHYTVVLVIDTFQMTETLCFFPENSRTEKRGIIIFHRKKIYMRKRMAMKLGKLQE